MEWLRGEVIGHGSFATVNLAIPKTQIPESTPRLMAVKSCGSSESALLLNEKSILEELSDCPQIIRCFGADFSLEKGERLCNVLLEYASGGSLSDRVKNSGNRRLPESEVRRHTRSVLKGLKCIHDRGFVHCDIKLQNILVCSDDVAKIADFGLAKRAGEERTDKVGVELRGTPLYMAPETVASGEQEAAADVWAVGCLVVEMVSGAPAWRCPPGDNVFRLLMRIGVGEESPEIPSGVSEEGRDFLGKCFLKDPRKRWTAEMLLNHPFITLDQSYDQNTVPLENNNTCQEASSPSMSPRGPFDFPDWELVGSSSSNTTVLPRPEYSLESNTDMFWDSSAAERIRRLVVEEIPDWSVSDSWVTVR